MAELDQLEPLDAAGILRMCRARYAELASYRDGGEVQFRLPDVSEDLPPELREIVRGPEYQKPIVTRFRSWFRRPRDLRFEWISHHPFPPLRHIEKFNAIWGGESGAFMRMSYDPATRSCSSGLHQAVASATGVSSGTAFHFASFFISGLGNGAPLDNLPLSGVKEIDVEGVACWQITTLGPERSPEIKVSQQDTLTKLGWKPEAIAEFLVDREKIEELSIGKGDLLLRRMKKGDRIETRRDIRVNVPLPDDLFVNGPGAHLPHNS